MTQFWLGFDAVLMVWTRFWFGLIVLIGFGTFLVVFDNVEILMVLTRA